MITEQLEIKKLTIFPNLMETYDNQLFTYSSIIHHKTPPRLFPRFEIQPKSFP